MKLIQSLLIAGITLAAAGCATDVSTSKTVRQSTQTESPQSIKKEKSTSYETVRLKTTFLTDPHIGASTATGPKIKYKHKGDNMWTDGYNIYNLVAIDVGRSGTNTVNFTDIQLRVSKSMTGTGFAYFHTAYSKGERFAFTEVDRDLDCYGGQCFRKEIVGIDMSMDKLREISERPIFVVKIVGKEGSTIVEVPQSYIQGFLAAISEKNRKGK